MGLRTWNRRFDEAAARRPVVLGLLSGVVAYPLLVLALEVWGAPGNAWLVALAGSLVLGGRMALHNVTRRDMDAEYEASRDAVQARQRQDRRTR